MPESKMAERIDDLQCRGYRIVQDTEGFCFGMDAVLLSNFSAKSIGRGERVLDLCCGNGIVPLLLGAKTEAEAIYGLEIQERAVELAKRSVELNGESGRIHILQGDLRNIREMELDSSMDKVTANPPYMNTGLRNPDTAKQIARHEVLCSFRDVAFAACHSLKSGGSFFLVHRPNRLVDIMTELRTMKLEPKRLQLIHPFQNREPNLFLMEAVKGAGRELRILPPLIVYKEPQVYTEEILRLYGRENGVV